MQDFKTGMMVDCCVPLVSRYLTSNYPRMLAFDAYPQVLPHIFGESVKSPIACVMESGLRDSTHC